MTTGDGSDFGPLFQTYADALYRFAHRRLRDRDDAEDAVHDAFVRIRRRGDAPADFDSPRAWMFSVLSSICADRGRRAARSRALFDSEASLDAQPDRNAPSAETIAGDAEALDDAFAALNLLPEADAEALSLVAIEGLSYREVASVVGAPIGTVRSRVSRARRTLREALRNSGASTTRPMRQADGTVLPFANGQGRKGGRL